MQGDRDQNKEQFRLIQTEIDLMKRLDHPNVLRLHECVRFGKVKHLVVELCNGDRCSTGFCIRTALEEADE